MQEAHIDPSIEISDDLFQELPKNKESSVEQDAYTFLDYITAEEKLALALDIKQRIRPFLDKYSRSIEPEVESVIDQAPSKYLNFALSAWHTVTPKHRFLMSLFLS